MQYIPLKCRLIFTGICVHGVIFLKTEHVTKFIIYKTSRFKFPYMIYDSTQYTSIYNRALDSSTYKLTKYTKSRVLNCILNRPYSYISINLSADASLIKSISYNVRIHQ
jgi:hypothetical protein